ncbi:MAG: type II toxin-antitoxin system VapC family toxin [Egibacteraceae bacterium]
MIIPDINVLVYATVTGFPLHPTAKSWWEAALNDPTPVGLAPPVVFGFLRIVTNPRVLDEPMSIRGAATHVREWMAVPAVELLTPGEAHVEVALALLEQVGTAANLTTDAQLAAFARQYDAVVHSNDSDFGKFADVRWVNPFTDR